MAVAALEPLLPAPPQLKVFYEPAELEALARRAGLEPRSIVGLDWTWRYPDLETLLRGWLSPGPSAAAVAAAGEPAVRDALAAAASAFRMSDGSYRLENVCRCLIAEARR